MCSTCLYAFKVSLPFGRGARYELVRFNDSPTNRDVIIQKSYESLLLNSVIVMRKLISCFNLCVSSVVWTIKNSWTYTALSTYICMDICLEKFSAVYFLHYNRSNHQERFPHYSTHDQNSFLMPWKNVFSFAQFTWKYNTTLFSTNSI
jgi:hypothetical protein